MMLQSKLYCLMLCSGLSLLLAHKLKAQPIIFQKPLSPRIANYDIDVRLNTKERILVSHEVLTWYNKSQHKITELQFHLYLNAFRNNKSTFMKESGGISRGFRINKDGWGYIEVNRITLLGEDLTKDMKFIHPDDDNQDDKTVFRLPLSRPLLPGEHIVLNIDFTAKLPTPPFERTGAQKEYFFVGQWFPKIGVYIDGKWNCHQFHANSEFFADFGVYNVHITVPEENIVGATGLGVEVQNNNDGTATHFFHAEDVHDFAWTTSPQFIEFTGKAQDVDIHVLVQPDDKGCGQRYLEAAKIAVEYFQNWYGDYPFPNLTIVEPRRGAGGSGGMEYPTLITAFPFYGLPAGIRLLEMTVIHEFGHNFWYHLVASNEFEEAWLDEGITSYSENQIMHDQYGSNGDFINFVGIKINDLQYKRGAVVFFPNLDPIVRNAWDFYSTVSYAINSYMKPTMMLVTLQNYLGKQTMQKVMRTYFERWRFKHPRTQDFINVVNEVSGQNLNWFFDQALFTNATLDYSISRVFTRKVEKKRGYDFTLSIQDKDTSSTNNDANATTLPAIIKDSASNFTDSKSVAIEHSTTDSIKAENKPKMYYSEVHVRRLGSFKFPVEVEVIFENGEKIHEKWDGKALWQKFRYVKPTRLVSATVDPDGKIPLDINFTNNSRTVKKQLLGINKLAVRCLFWIQFLLDQPEILNLFSGLSLIL